MKLNQNYRRNQEVVSLDLKAIQSTDQNLKKIYLKKNDIIYIPEQLIYSISRFMSHLAPILSPFLMLESGIVLWPNVIDAIEGTQQEPNIVVPTN